MTNQINDWDVMQSGYGDEQLYPELPEVKPRLVVLGLSALSDRTLARYMAAAEVTP